jgi:predicted nucleic-acid-binding protein
MINKLAYHMELVFFAKRGDFVAREDTESVNVFFVKEGEFEIIKQEVKHEAIADFMDDRNARLKFNNAVSGFRSSSTIFEKTLKLN